MKHFLLVFFLMASIGVSAQQYIEMKLWSTGAPNSNGVITPEEYPRADRIASVSEPSLMIYPASNPNGLAVIACPGGAYTFLSMGQEGHLMAQWFNALGITYAVLKYRMPNNGHYEVPLTDAQRAICLMREHASEWNISKVGILGSSAGGHLASTAATHFMKENRPDFQILLYPVITMDATCTHKGTRKQLLGEQPSDEWVKYYSNELQVTPETPPAFILHCSDDKVVPVVNSVNYYLALKKNNVSAALHIYPKGGHGFGFYDTFHYKSQWTNELEKWLMEEIK